MLNLEVFQKTESSVSTCCLPATNSFAALIAMREPSYRPTLAINNLGKEETEVSSELFGQCRPSSHKIGSRVVKLDRHVSRRLQYLATDDIRGRWQGDG